MKMLKIAAACAISLAVVGCASIAGSNTRMVKVESVPAGASVKMDGQNVGTTPAVVTLPTYIYGGKTLTLSKRGYQDQNRVINTSFQPIAILDILFWPSIIIDAATGSLVKIDPANLNINATLDRA